jgi:hypothetical protein
MPPSIIENLNGGPRAAQADITWNSSQLPPDSPRPSKLITLTVGDQGVVTKKGGNWLYFTSKSDPNKAGTYYLLNSY